MPGWANHVSAGCLLIVTSKLVSTSGVFAPAPAPALLKYRNRLPNNTHTASLGLLSARGPITWAMLDFFGG